MKIRVLNYQEWRKESFDKDQVIVATSQSKDFGKAFSPFFLGPINATLPNGEEVECKIFENYWQFSKTFAYHIGPDGNPSDLYLKWAKAGFLNPQGVRYPMGKGAKPEYSYFKGKKLGYVDARKQIYVPYYMELVYRTPEWNALVERYTELKVKGKDLILIDFDGYDHYELGMTLKDVLNNPNRSMGHAFVLAAMLMKEK